MIKSAMTYISRQSIRLLQSVPCQPISFGPRLRAVLLAALTLAALVPAISISAWAAETQTVEIATKGGVQIFVVEMAVTMEERAQGLMYRKELPDGKGMLFDFSPEQNVAMWMKNTYIPLDMIFIKADGRILRIAENTEPLSTEIVSSGGSVRAVLEVIGGTARKYGIAPGDQVSHALFGKR